ncbi:unnamed protein product [Periconia digitata]|uniref:Phosphatidate cytidylyltransferase n=1 Tax=Periconia digitata TaxID=1303443 RepID=A0A9W4U8H4_9PLEO|nr:unnamed protein product [Periconia digitata]
MRLEHSNQLDKTHPPLRFVDSTAVTALDTEHEGHQLSKIKSGLQSRPPISLPLITHCYYRSGGSGIIYFSSLCGISTVASFASPSDDAGCPDESASQLTDLEAAQDHCHHLNLIVPPDSTATLFTTTPTTATTEPRRVSLLDSVSQFWLKTCLSLSGLIRTSPLPSFQCAPHAHVMASSAQYQVPRTPRVISPSPDPSESSAKDGYFGPTTRSAARKQRLQSPPSIEEDSSGSDPDKRARARSRSPIYESRRRRMSGLAAKRQANGKPSKAGDLKLPNGSTVNGHLSPQAANRNYWRELSRSPSPLGLIPIHQKWRSFIHRHEVPRKILHTSIGFLTLALYGTGRQPSQIHPVLLTLLIPITLSDVIRHKWWQVNRLYIRCLGALMRESEVDGWNGVISYLLGAWLVLRFFPKDVGVMSVLLLSWCDTAASTFGRLWGHRTWRVRKGKSLAGSIAACVVGVITAAVFWGSIAPRFARYDTGENAFAYQGALTLPAKVRETLSLDVASASVTGWWALGVVSLAAGLVASTSEAIDLFGWDDNLTIPVLCGAGLWAFLRGFAS